MPAKISKEEYREARNNYYGWCARCEDFTRPCTEPDIRVGTVDNGYHCPECGDNVMGAEEAMFNGTVEIAGWD